MATFAEYMRHWDEMALRDASLREHLRKDALRTARNLVDILAREFRVTKVILFGSVVKEKSFDDFSDIDIAVEGLRKRAYFSALARLMMESQFEIDLKPIEDVSDLLRQRIEKGLLLYERERIPDLISEISEELPLFQNLVFDVGETRRGMPSSRRKKRIYEGSLASNRIIFTLVEKEFSRRSQTTSTGERRALSIGISDC